MDTPDNQERSAPSVRESLAAAMAEVAPAQEAPTEAVAAVNAVEPPQPNKARDEAGRFAPQNDAVTTAPQATEDKPAAPSASDAGPPASWNAQSRDLFSKADPALQAYIRQREIEQAEGVRKLKAEYEPKAQFANEMLSTIAPYADLIKSEGGTPAAAVRDLLQTAALFRKGTPEQKQAALVQIAQQFNVPLPGSASAPQPVAAPQIDPDAIANRVMSTLTERQRQEAMVKEIETFKADKPYFDYLAPAIGRVLAEGKAETLQQAHDLVYEQVIGPVLKTQAAAATQVQQKDQRQAHAVKAKGAAVSVAGAPGLAGTPVNGKPAPSLREEIARSYAAAGRA